MAHALSVRWAVRRGLPTLAAAALLAFPALSHAQNALGNGDALDGSLRRNSGGYNNRTGNSNLSYRARNLLVTGNVPGGRGFRASVGYTAAGDFRGQLGSDDLFGFRSGSALSSPRFFTQPTAQELRYGQQLGSVAYRRSAAPTIGQEQVIRQSIGARNSDYLRLDRMAQARTSLETIDTAMEGRIIGQTPAGPLHSSSLRGVRLLATEEDPQNAGISMYDRLKLREEKEEGMNLATPGIPYQLRFDLVGATSLVEPRGVVGRGDPLIQDQRIPSLQTPEYQRILEQIADRYAGSQDATWAADGDLVAQIARDYEQLQEQLGARGSLYGVPGTGAKDADDATRKALDSDNEDEEDEASGLFGLIGVNPNSDAARRQIEDGLQRFGAVLRHGERIDRLGTNDVGRFNELLRSAEQRLREGEYFWAERRFIRALQFVPGHPTATAGLGHAQLGAGIYGSAALTLRSLFTHQPEMIDARYDERLLPSHLLLTKAVDELHQRGEHVSRPGHDGFLIAYIGHQLEEPDLVKDGLQIMTTESPDDPLLVVLREVWQAKPLVPLPKKETVESSEK